MSMDSENTCVLLSSRDSRSSCIFKTAEEKDEIPGLGEESSVLEMLSYSKFSDLEARLCMPSSLLLPQPSDSTHSSSSNVSSSNRSSLSSCRSTCSEPAEACAALRWLERGSPTLPQELGKEADFMSTPLLPVLCSTPTSQTSVGNAASRSGVNIRKRRRLTASPGGLHWNSAGKLQRDFYSPYPSPSLRTGVSEAGRGGARGADGGRASSMRAGGRTALRKTKSADETLLQSAGRQRHLRLLGRLDRGRRKLHGAQGAGTSGRYEGRKKSESKLSLLAQRWNHRTSGDVLIRDLRSTYPSGILQSSLSLDRNLDSRHLPGVLTLHMQNLQLTQNRKFPSGPASPSAAKRLYRNLSEKLRGSTSSFEDAYFFRKTDRLRKSSMMLSSDCIFDAVEQQDLDAVQILLCQFSADDLDLNTPNSQGLTPLDIAIMTNNTPIAKLLLKAGGKESPHFVNMESREAHLRTLVEEAEQRAADLAAQAQKDGLSLEACHRDKALRTWEWRSKLYRRMRTGFQHAGYPEAPSMVRLSVSSSSTLTVTFHEPQSLNSTVVTRYRVEWSCLKDFSLLAGEMVMDNLQSLKCTISGLSTGRLYYVRVAAYNMKGWGPPACSLPPSAAPSSWRENHGQEPRRRGHIEAMERLLQQVRATHTHYCCGDNLKLQNSSRKQSVSRSLKHLFNSSNKFVKTLKRGVYLAAIFHHQDSVLVTAEDHIPIVEVDDSFGSSLMQDFLWFMKLSCMWEDVRWLQQSMSVSMSSSSTLQARHKMLSAAVQLQSLLGTHNLGRVHYEPIKDRHGNVLLVTVRHTESQDTLLNGKWMQVTKLQSQRKSVSTPEEPHALDILTITLQDIMLFQRCSSLVLDPGLYLGYLKLSSSVDQIKVLVSQQTPSMLCHARIRDNANVSREEWDWIQSLADAGRSHHKEEAEPQTESHTPLLYYELQTAIKSLLKLVNLTVHQAAKFRLYSREVVELGHGVTFLLLLPPADDVCSAPGQSNPYTPLSGFLHLPLQMFELVHFCTYKEKFISLYCRLSSVLDLDALVTQQALREAITDGEVSTARTRHQLILDYIQQLDEMRRDLRWISDALQNARYKHPSGGAPVRHLVATGTLEDHPICKKTSSTSSTMDFLASTSGSPELRRQTAVSASLIGSDDNGSSEVFLPTDSDYDSSDALSPRDLDPRCDLDLSQQNLHWLGGSAPDVLQIQELRCSICPSTDPAPLPSSPSLPLSDTTMSLESLSLSRGRGLTNPTSKKVLARSHRGQYFSGPSHWLWGHAVEQLPGSSSEGVYTPQPEPDPPPPEGAAYISQISCVLEGRRGLHQKPHVKKIFMDSLGPERSQRDRAVSGSMGVAKTDPAGQGEEPQENDSDDQTNIQVSKILSSTL